MIFLDAELDAIYFASMEESATASFLSKKKYTEDPHIVAAKPYVVSFSLKLSAQSESTYTWVEFGKVQPKTSSASLVPLMYLITRLAAAKSCTDGFSRYF